MSLDELRALVAAMVGAGVVELEAQVDGAPVRVVRRAGDGAATLAPPPTPPGAPPRIRQAGEPAPQDPALEARDQIITSPLAGRVLAVLVGERSRLHAGRVVADVEAAGLVSEVEATGDGRVTRVLVEPGQAVDVGTPLVALTTP